MTAARCLAADVVRDLRLVGEDEVMAYGDARAAISVPAGDADASPFAPADARAQNHACVPTLLAGIACERGSVPNDREESAPTETPIVAISNDRSTSIAGVPWETRVGPLSAPSRRSRRSLDFLAFRGDCPGHDA